MKIYRHILNRHLSDVHAVWCERLRSRIYYGDRIITATLPTQSWWWRLMLRDGIERGLTLIV